MKKTKFSKILILLIVVCFTCSLFLLTACNNPDSSKLEPNLTEKDKQDVKNGNFMFASGEEYPRTVSDWTGSLNGGSDSLKPDGGLDVIKHGMINVGKDYDKSSKKWDSLANPGKYKEDADDNMLMIYGKKPTSFTYRSDNFEVKANSYYKLTFYVKTVNIKGVVDDKGNKAEGTQSGVYISVSDSGNNFYNEWVNIDTQSAWQKFELYIEGDAKVSRNLRISFSLGLGDKQDKHLTEGYAFFDDVTLTSITKADYDNAPVNKKPANSSEAYIRKDSFVLSNANFVNYESLYDSAPYGPKAWSFDYGGKGEDASNKIDNTPSKKYGLVDFSTLNADNISRYSIPSDKLAEFKKRNDSADDSALLLYTSDMFSMHYSSKSQITIKKGKIYEISVWVKTIDTVTDKTTKGTIILSNANEDYRISFDNTNYYTKDKDGNITATPLTKSDKNNGWAQITLNVRGNSVRDVNYDLTLALGTDGISKKDTNWSCGHVLFDDITIKEINVEPNKPSSSVDNWQTATNNFAKFDLNKLDSTGEVKNYVENGMFVNGELGKLPTNFTKVEKKNTDIVFPTGSTLALKNDVERPFNAIYKFGDSSNVAENVLAIKSDRETTVTIEYAKSIETVMNKHYRLAFWVKTADMPKTTGMFFNVRMLDENDKVVKTETISMVNSANLNEEQTKLTKGWQEVVFYIAGDSLKNTNFKFDFSYGAGETTDAETLARGEAYIYNINMQMVDLKEYNNASTNELIKKVAFTSSSTSTTPENGNFNKVVNSDSSFDENGKLDKFATPQNWTLINDGEYENHKKDTTKKGIVDLSYNGEISDATPYDFNKTQLSTIFTNEKISGLTFDANTFKMLNNSGENNYALAIYGAEDTIVAYKSSTISLDAESYYYIRFRVYTNDGAKATIKLTTKSPHEQEIKIFNNISSTDKWTEYSYFIETGMTNASVQLVASLGNIDDKTTSKGLVMFDDAVATKIQKVTYDKLKEEVNSSYSTTVIFDTDGFTTTDDDKEKLNSPNGWSNTIIDNPVTIKDKPASLSGVIDLKHYDATKVWERTEEGELTTTDSETVKAFLNKKNALISNVLNPEKGYLPAFGNEVLMLDNIIANGQKTYTSTSKKLSSKSYYKVSIWLYVELEADSEYGLNMSLRISDREHDVARLENIKSTNGWKEFTFYVDNSNEKSSSLSANLTLQLGSREKVDDKDILKAVKGTVFADNFKVEKIEKVGDKTAKQIYDEAVAEITNGTNKNSANIVYVPEDADKDKDEKDPEKDKKPVDWTMLSWAIPTIILAVMLIAVLGVFIYKKYALPKKHTKFKGDKKHKVKKEEVKKEDDFNKFND